MTPQQRPTDPSFSSPADPRDPARCGRVAIPADDTLDEIVSNLWEHAIDAPWFASLTEQAQRLKLKEWLVDSGVHELIEQAESLTAVVLRFAGPICTHDGRRAVEHEQWSASSVMVPVRWICNRCEYGDHGGHLSVRCDGRYGSGQIDGNGISRGCDCVGPHPPAPEIIAWLGRSR